MRKKAEDKMGGGAAFPHGSQQKIWHKENRKPDKNLLIVYQNRKKIIQSRMKGKFIK